MRKHAFILAILASLVAGCGDESSDNNTSGTCKVNVCKDASTLIRCDGGISREESCGLNKECRGNACVDKTSGNTCDVDVCKDASILIQCFVGIPMEVPCGENKECRGNACVDKTSGNTCDVDVCKDLTTLIKCNGGVPTEESCAADKECRGNACVAKTPSDGSGCKTDTCKDSSTMNVCENGKYVEYSCGAGRECKAGKCVALGPVLPTCLPQCVVDPAGKVIDPGNDGEADWDKYHACVNESISTGLTSCDTGKICLYGGCVDSFSEKDTCEDAAGTGYCTADLMHAVVCAGSGKKTIWTCKAPCSVGSDGIVDCPKDEPKYDNQCENDYKANCYNDNNNVHVCVNHQIESWDCYGGSCSVDANNVVSCPKNAGIAGLGGIESGGTYGDMCNTKKYKEACIDNYYARICDKDGYVRIKPAGDCKETSGNKVEYSVPASCDTTQYMPFCINNGKAIGFCAYDNPDDLTVGVYKAAQCPSCNSVADAEACMFL